MTDEEAFAARPVLVSPCLRCGGCGTIAREYFLHPDSDEIPGAPLGAIRAFVAGSAFIGEACAEASDLARRAGRPVAFLFSDRLVVVRPEDAPAVREREWWIAVHGVTPEEFARGR